jgi:hypothetical protein
VDTNILKNRGVNLLVKTKILESYVVHADPDSVPGFVARDLLIDMGRIARLINDWVKCPNELEKIEEAEAIFEMLPGLDYFEGLPLSISDDYFFEGMISTVRTYLLSVQASIHLEKNKITRVMSRELANLKENYEANFLRIKNRN